MKEIKITFSVPSFLMDQKTKKIFRNIILLGWLTFTFFVWKSYDFSIFEMAILAYLGISFIWKTPSRFSTGLALIFLALTPIFLMLKNEALAEKVVVYAYYFLVITVIQEVWEVRRGKKIG